MHDTANESAAKELVSPTGQTDCSVSIGESNKCYDVAIPIPAAKKEHMAVYVEDHIATVAVFGEHKIANNETGAAPDQLDMLFRKKISLPEDADADFIHAVYNRGVLHLFISKSNKPCSVSFHPVAVY